MDRQQCELQLDQNPIDNYARFRLADILIQEGKDIDTARKLIESIRLSNKKFMKAECLELLGDIENLDSIKNYPEAIKLYIKSAKKKPDVAHIYIKLGKTHEKMREFDEAITYIKKALRRDKDCFAAHYRLGVCFIRNNQRQEGIDSLKTALSLKPNDIDTLTKLSEIYFSKENKIDLAAKLMKKVIQ